VTAGVRSVPSRPRAKDRFVMEVGIVGILVIVLIVLAIIYFAKRV
jgi:hypothetical protein